MTLVDVFATSPVFFIGSVFLLSLLIGSFLNVVIHRVPIMLDREWKAQAKEILAAGEGQQASASASEPTAHSLQPTASPKYNLVVPRSACPSCGKLITASQNIPVISYLLLRGRCANCKVRISPRYPIVELSTALLSALVAWRFGFHWYTAAALFLTWALIALTFIDFDTQLLPDNITLSLVWLGLILSLAHVSGEQFPVDSRSSILGGVAGYLSLWSVYWLFKLVTGKEGMGYGDFKLFAAFGTWLGWKMLPLIILLSAFTGAVVGIVLIAARGRDRNIPIPFGPYLAAAGWIALMWGEEIVGGYLRISGLG
jgi:leader peptidase (prepilin peptidase) / N-methyltransferase